MFAAPLFTQGSASPASADNTWVGIALDATPNDYLGDSAYTIFTTLDTVNGDPSQQRIAQISTRRGRQFELDRIEAGEGDTVLRNADGKIDPANVSSPYYPNLKPLKKVRIVRHQTGVRYPLFDGFIERLTPNYRVARSFDGTIAGIQDVDIGLVDAFEILQNTLLRSGFQSYTYGPDGNTVKLVFTATAAGASDITVELACPGANTASTTVTVTVRAIKVNLRTNASNAPLATGNEVLAAMQASAAASALVTTTLISGGGNALQVTGTTGAQAMSGGAYPQELSGARISRGLDSIAWATDGRDIDTGRFQVVSELFGVTENPTSALDHFQEVAEGEAGYVFVSAAGKITFHGGDHRSTSPRSTISQATFTDDGGAGIPYQSISIDYSRDHVVNDVTVTSGLDGAVGQNVTDAASQAENLPRSTSIQTKLASDADALAVANNILAAYKDAVPRIQQLVTVDDGTVAWRMVLALEIGDLITVRSNPPAHDTSIAYQCFVENIQHDLAYDQPHRVTLQLTETSASVSGSGSGGGTGGGGGGGEPVVDSDGDAFTLDDPAKGILG